MENFTVSLKKIKHILDHFLKLYLKKNTLVPINLLILAKVLLLKDDCKFKFDKRDTERTRDKIT